MAAVKGVNITNLDATPVVLPKASNVHGRIRAWYDTYEASALAAASTITLARLSPSASYVYATAGMAGSGLADFANLRDYVGRYRVEFAEALRVETDDDARLALAEQRRVPAIGQSRANDCADSAGDRRFRNRYRKPAF